MSTITDARDASYLIVPGWGGSGDDHWQTRWARELPATTVELADWFDPRRDAWLAAVDDAYLAHARRDPRPPVVVAHSLGCVVLAHWVRSRGGPIRGALLVAPADVERAPGAAALRAFAPAPQFALPFPTLVATSDDDPYISVARATLLATAWQSELHVVTRGGHLNAASNLGDWPAGRELLATLLRSRDEAPRMAVAGVL